MFSLLFSFLLRYRGVLISFALGFALAAVLLLPRGGGPSTAAPPPRRPAIQAHTADTARAGRLWRGAGRAYVEGQELLQPLPPPKNHADTLARLHYLDSLLHAWR